MNTLSRWLCFNAVGAVGMGLQLGVVYVLNRLLPGHALLVTSLALELVLLHNFTGHVLYTWRDRRAGARLLHWLLRFHLTNGAVSFAGNLAATWTLVRLLGLPVLLANLAAILACSLLNFCLGHFWSFAQADAPIPT